MTKLKRFEPTRRQMLIGTTASGVAVTGGGAWIFNGDPKNFIVALIDDALPYINFEPGAIENFAEQYYVSVTDQRRDNIDKVTKMYRTFGLSGLDAVLGKTEKYANFRRTMITTFLIETSFFDPDRDINAPVEFIGYNPCKRNPFAQFS